MLAAAVLLLAYAGARAPERVLRAASTAVMPLALLGIWLANSRGAGAALLIGCVVLIAATSDRGRLLRVIGLGLAGALVLVLVARGMHALTSGVVDSDSRAQGDQLSALCVAVAAAVCAVAWAIDDWVPRISIGRSAAVGVAIACLLGVIVAVIAVDPAQRFDEFKAPPPRETGAPSDRPSSRRMAAGSSGPRRSTRSGRTLWRCRRGRIRELVGPSSADFALCPQSALPTPAAGGGAGTSGDRSVPRIPGGRCRRRAPAPR